MSHQDNSPLTGFLYASAAANTATAAGLFIETLPKNFTGVASTVPPIGSLHKQTVGFLLAMSAVNAIRGASRPKDAEFRKWLCRTFCVGNVWFLGSALRAYVQNYRLQGTEHALWGVPAIAWAVIEGAVFAYYGFGEELGLVSGKASSTAKRTE